jgi:hypothetical protein
MPGHTPKEKKKVAKKVSRKISVLRKEGKQQKQSVAIALNKGKKPKKK